jgi:calcium-dependent protein kinase
MAFSCGTLAFTAPEVLRKSYSGSQCDLWSAGVVAFIMLSGDMPFFGSKESQIKSITSATYAMDEGGWLDASEDSKDFVRSLLVVDPHKRLTAARALEHKWIAQRDKIEISVGQDTVNALEMFSKESKFRRAALSMMAWSLTYEERRTVRDTFLIMDKDHTGTIKFSELKKLLSEEFHITDERTNQIFEALDSNHDGTIHYSDFLAAMCSTRIALHDDLFKKTFNKFDADSSGFITLENLKVVLGESFSQQERASLMTELDENGDGQISYEEFLHYCRESGNEIHSEAASRIEPKTPMGTETIESRRCGPERESSQRNLSLKKTSLAETSAKVTCNGPLVCLTGVLEFLATLLHMPFSAERLLKRVN